MEDDVLKVKLLEHILVEKVLGAVTSVGNKRFLSLTQSERRGL